MPMLVAGQGPDIVPIFGTTRRARLRENLAAPSIHLASCDKFLLDQTYLAASERTAYGPAEFRRYWGWLGTYLLGIWLAAVAAGLVVAPLLPPLPHLGLVGVALFVAMLVPRLVSRTVLLVAGASGVIALVAAQVVPEVAILAGCAAGVLVGIVADRSLPASLGGGDR